MVNSHDFIQTSQNNLAAQRLSPLLVKAKLTIDELTSRLTEDKPALTIVDVRDPKDFNQEHIKGAISVPFSRLENLARSSLAAHRDIYIYGESDEQSLLGSQILLGTGFVNVAQIIGGLATWHKIAGATEGIGI